MELIHNNVDINSLLTKLITRLVEKPFPIPNSSVPLPKNKVNIITAAIVERIIDAIIFDNTNLFLESPKDSIFLLVRFLFSSAEENKNLTSKIFIFLSCYHFHYSWY